MPRCSICGKAVRAGEVAHSDCRKKWEAEIREEIERELESRAATIRERERKLSEREEKLQKREENVLDREEELDIREEAAEIQSQLFKELLEEARTQLQRARWFLFFNMGMAAGWVCWNLIKIVA
ncbi:MAG: hypothetical protein IJO61_06715 [Oscillospiraceae bacterium]|nr:hypothetical protein [Oscillospiraceae bacterium]MBQ7120153.1 hypothetical protein [Oscillospiraceae bacterium]